MNQCDVCKLNLPIENGIHIHPGEKKGSWNRLHMVCTKGEYEECKPLEQNDEKH